MREVVHPNPVWRDRANFIIAAKIAQDNGSEEYEQMWARQVSATTYQLCCIPFIAYDLALGDTVETDADHYVIQRVVEPSGHYTFRAWLADAANEDARDALLEKLRSLGSEWEWMSPRLVAIDAANDDSARAIAAFLAERESRSELVYETGRSK